MSLTRNMSFAVALLGLTGLGLAAAPLVHAQTAIVAVTGGTSRNAGNDPYANGTVGFAFTTGSSPDTLVALGYYAPTTLTETHQVGLFDTSGDLLTSGTVSAGSTGTPATANFAYTSVLTASYTLTANTTYILGGYTGLTNADSFLDTTTSVSSPSNFTIGHPYFSLYNGGPGGFSFPNTDGKTGYNVTNSYFGPNALVSPAPEPSQLAGLGFAAFGVLGLMVKARKSKVSKSTA